MELRTTTSTSLLEGLKDPRNAEAWRAFIERYRPLIVRFAVGLGCRQHDAEDLAQETLFDFCRAYQAGRYDRDRGRLRSWIFGMAANEAQKRHRRHRGLAVPVAELEEAASEPWSPGAAEELWDREWRAAILEASLREVRREVQPRTFEAFELFALKEWPASRVAESLGMSVNAVFLAKSRILRRVRELLPLMEEIW